MPDKSAIPFILYIAVVLIALGVFASRVAYEKGYGAGRHEALCESRVEHATTAQDTIRAMVAGCSL